MKSVIVAGLLAAFVTLSVVLEVRLLHPMPGLAQLIWDDDEAFLFVEEAVSGWRMSALQFGAAAEMALLGHAARHEPRVRAPPPHELSRRQDVVREASSRALWMRPQPGLPRECRQYRERAPLP
jgi:hypothetical protein